MLTTDIFPPLLTPRCHLWLQLSSGETRSLGVSPYMISSSAAVPNQVELTSCVLGPLRSPWRCHDPAAPVGTSPADVCREWGGKPHGSPFPGELDQDHAAAINQADIGFHVTSRVAPPGRVQSRMSPCLFPLE